MVTWCAAMVSGQRRDQGVRAPVVGPRHVSVVVTDLQDCVQNQEEERAAKVRGGGPCGFAAASPPPPHRAEYTGACAADGAARRQCRRPHLHWAVVCARRGDGPSSRPPTLVQERTRAACGVRVRLSSSKGVYVWECASPGFLSSCARPAPRQRPTTMGRCLSHHSLRAVAQNLLLLPSLSYRSTPCAHIVGGGGVSCTRCAHTTRTTPRPHIHTQPRHPGPSRDPASADSVPSSADSSGLLDLPARRARGPRQPAFAFPPGGAAEACCRPRRPQPLWRDPRSLTSWGAAGWCGRTSSCGS